MVLRRGVRSLLFVCLIAGVSEAQDRVTIRGSVPPLAQGVNDQGAVTEDFRLGNITLMLKRSDAQQAALEDLLARQQNPASPEYHNWLTPETYAERFGAGAADLQIVQGWLAAEGFTVKYTARGRDFISFSGTAGQVRKAFGTEIHRYTAGARAHFANATDVSLPADIAPLIGGIRGLDDFHPRAPRKLTPPNFTVGDGTYLLVPDDFAAIYNLFPLYLNGYTGAGQSIAILGQSQIDPDDVAYFRALSGMPPGEIQLLATGADPGFNEDEIEADLDLEWAGAVARFANLIYVYSDDVQYSAYYAIDNAVAPVISESFGLCEYQVARHRLGLFDFRTEAQKANALGITWLASSGDSGAAGCDADGVIATQGLGVSLPASVPEVTAVGGTEFNEGAGNYWSAGNGPNGGSALSYIPETSWNDTVVTGMLSASGGGASAVYPKPAWQTGAGVPNDGARDVPDVSMNASDAHDPYAVVTLGQLIGVGGTSASAPSFAGVVALLNQYVVENQVQAKPGLGNINPKLYSLAAGGAADLFHDVTTGSNMVPCRAKSPNCSEGQFGYQAGPGYDLVTGLGSVDAYNLVVAWGGIPLTGTTMTLAATPATVAPGGSTAVTATVKAASGTRSPTGTVSFTLGANSIGTATLSGAGGTATATVTVFAANLLAASNPIQAFYAGSPTFSSSSAGGTVGLGAAPTASAVTLTVTPNPVYQQAPDANGATFSFTVQVQETAGVATTLTGLSFDGLSFAGLLTRVFGGTTLAPHGTLTANLKAGNVPVPSSLPLMVSGRDASGASWAQQVMISFQPAQ